MEDFDEFIETFVTESQDALETWEKICMDALEMPIQEEWFKTLFRIAHNMKGSSQSIGLSVFGSTVHLVEELITGLRDGKIDRNSKPHWAEVLLGIQKQLSDWLTAIRTHAPNCKDCPSEVLASQAMIQKILTSEKQGKNDDVISDDIIFDLDVLDTYKNQIAESKSGAITNVDITELSPSAEKSKTENKPLNANITDVNTELITEKNSVTNDNVTTINVTTSQAIKISTAKIEDVISLLEENIADYQNAFQNIYNTYKLDPSSNTYLLLKNLRSGLFKTLENAQSLLDEVPVTLAQKLKRSVLDLAKKQDKDVNFRIKGDQTPIRKEILNEIGDPLMHMLRNAVDHGLESKSDRAKAGKKSQGTLNLEILAKPNGTSIDVYDDGAGLNEEKIRKKAAQNGLISVEKLNSLTRDEVLQFILKPGFSTVDKVTEVSGRGVGMDVVDRSIKQLGGLIQIRSTPGQGTRFSIWLPATSLTQQCLIARCNKVFVAFADNSVLHVVNLNKVKWQTENTEALSFQHQGTSFALFDLGSYLGESGEGKSKKTGYAFTFKKDNLFFAIRVDQVVGIQFLMLKKLKGNIKNVAGISGISNTQMGDIVTILDADELVSVVWQGGVKNAA